MTFLHHIDLRVCEEIKRADQENRWENNLTAAGACLVFVYEE